MSIETSNRLTDLSARIRQASDRAKAASVKVAEQYLEAGRGHYAPAANHYILCFDPDNIAAFTPIPLSA